VQIVGAANLAQALLPGEGGNLNLISASYIGSQAVSGLAQLG
jgi:hypothetical protein